jgi:hypothetical protein
MHRNFYASNKQLAKRAAFLTSRRMWFSSPSNISLADLLAGRRRAGIASRHDRSVGALISLSSIHPMPFGNAYTVALSRMREKLELTAPSDPDCVRGSTPGVRTERSSVLRRDKRTSAQGFTLRHSYRAACREMEE